MQILEASGSRCLSKETIDLAHEDDGEGQYVLKDHDVRTDDVEERLEGQELFIPDA